MASFPLQQHWFVLHLQADMVILSLCNDLNPKQTWMLTYWRTIGYNGISLWRMRFCSSDLFNLVLLTDNTIPSHPTPLLHVYQASTRAVTCGIGWSSCFTEVLGLNGNTSPWGKSWEAPTTDGQPWNGQVGGHSFSALLQCESGKNGTHFFSRLAGGALSQWKTVSRSRSVCRSGHIADKK